MSAPRTRPTEAELAEFRDRVRAHIAEHAPPFEAREGHRAPETGEQEVLLRTWFASLFDAGFVGADWPVEYGGRADHHPLHDRIVSEEILRARAPRPVDQVNLAAHVLLHFGTDEQKSALLPPIRSSEHVWCQLLSEPDAGSDIAAVRCKGTPRPDGSWVIDGQKTWITDGHWADMGLALIRTDPTSSRHHGLSAFIVPLNAPGVEIRPIRTINEAIEVNEVFFDDVTIPPDSLIGEPGQGWSIIMAGLDFERFGIGGNVILLELLIDDLVTVARHGRIDDMPALQHADIRHQVAELAVEVEVAKAFIDDHVERLVAGAEQTGDGSIAKLSFAETYHRVSAYGAQLSTMVCTLATDPDVALAKQRLKECWLWSRAYTVSGGSSEMMRNILAKRRLLLPTH
ncbi:acyl-CoA dehydrogenase [Mycolicibacterium novocastrense]|uniref:Acyl-CoA dehydrogenase n=1 Tax=Mycolicibacterium novocastrense TaxID=59813 RepID=A0AAW5SG77_MYCNV|nr:acyl-CoA dehydrogenase family protein [Mycolicibacterium novocastrense]KUH70919.1 acyl-CoA dehydrogenase [Mycolicibacterium novocastrense]KUH72819.1 acyl-CoA dehydrogenase [Mycolicibacterium novocastrense]KUH76998.1 acyl-CoA dehydrogenase [Mycolicibacterium novocastrense]MCV7023095.1 acyl-CoA dehydrogenase family protein [Mycolicibacterium novocastrense]GAT10812.1 acyl-CoA dehydrogenase [Mycolicibacterium novocastrense]